MFRATYDSLSYKFANEMKSEFEMSMIGELNFFFGIQVKKYDNGIFISQSNYVWDIVKKFGMKGKSHARTSISTFVKISSDPTGKCVDSILYKSMIRSLLYITTTIHFFFIKCKKFIYQWNKAGEPASHRIFTNINREREQAPLNMGE